MQPYIIIGAGILGASAAYHLSKRGESVLLIHKEDYGEATRSSAGIISPWLSQKRHPILYEINKNGAKYYSELLKQLYDDRINITSYKKSGSLHLHKNEEKLDKMMNELIKVRQHAPEIGEISKLTGEDIANEYPFMTSRMGGVLISGGGRVNGDELRNGLVEAAKKYGAKVIQGEAALTNESKVEVDSKTYNAKKILVTNGAWVNHLFDEPMDITSQKTEILELYLPGYNTDQWPVIMLPNNKYIVGFDQGKILVGSAHEENHDFEAYSSASGIYEILKVAFKFVPVLEKAKFIESRVGFRPLTKDRHPTIKYLPNNSDIIVANGLGASGITNGPYLGKKLTDFILSGENPFPVN